MAAPRPDLYDLRTWPRERLDRFLAFVRRGKPNECWPWTGSLGGKGHGRYRFRERGRVRSVFAHRVVWMLEHGPGQPAEVNHRCLNLSCCNAAHLVAGDAATRTRLLVVRGRSIAGTKHHAARLTPAAVRRLLRLREREPDLTAKELASRVGLKSWTWVNAILRRQGWRSVQTRVLRHTRST